MEADIKTPLGLPNPGKDPEVLFSNRDNNKCGEQEPPPTQPPPAVLSSDMPTVVRRAENLWKWRRRQKESPPLSVQLLYSNLQARNRVNGGLPKWKAPRFPASSSLAPGLSNDIPGFRCRSAEEYMVLYADSLLLLAEFSCSIQASVAPRVPRAGYTKSVNSPEQQGNHEDFRQGRHRDQLFVVFIVKMP
ncbi:hypothetical protein GDO81_028057 [Engystomops pustulosus]|uniref:Uncharacterized protein n=1 Tax=Engystomops pustulosus TaxID=76066 RepID=A0AAV6Z7I6_ENGPU|nr:hypothetical protein GDO81_028057 [Engystomops pustulosus]